MAPEAAEGRFHRYERVHEHMAAGQTEPGHWPPDRARILNRLAPAAATIAIAAVAAVGGCGDGPTGPPQPSSLVALSGNGQTGVVGTTLVEPLVVRVTDRMGKGVASATVSWQVTAGGGTLGAVSTRTSQDGTASVVWALGKTAGTNTASARVTGLPPVTFTATGLSGPPKFINAVSGNSQTAVAGKPVSAQPRVQITDEFGNPVSGVPVTFEVTMGGGSVTGGSTTTDAGGFAAPLQWTLGDSPGQNQLTATSPVGTVTFIAFALPAPPATSEFDIEIRFVDLPDPAHQLAVAEAAARWEAAVVGDVPDINLALPPNGCFPGQPPVNERVDDLLVFVRVVPSIGSGALAQAGPCVLRGFSGLPALGVVEINGTRLAELAAGGKLYDVVLHELGHVLGIGSLWRDESFAHLVAGAGTDDPRYTGPNGIAGYHASNGLAGTVPVENAGGGGTRDSHWREEALANELMTGFLQLSGSNPLSRITIGALMDLGYITDPDEADPYTVPPSGVAMSEQVLDLRNDVADWPRYLIERDGTVPRTRNGEDPSESTAPGESAPAPAPTS